MGEPRPSHVLRQRFIFTLFTTKWTGGVFAWFVFLLIASSSRNLERQNFASAGIGQSSWLQFKSEERIEMKTNRINFVVFCFSLKSVWFTTRTWRWRVLTLWLNRTKKRKNFVVLVVLVILPSLGLDAPFRLFNLSVMFSLICLYDAQLEAGKVCTRTELTYYE